MSPRRVHHGYSHYSEQRHARPDQPLATYWLLGAIVAVYVAEIAVATRFGLPTFIDVFAIHVDWMYRPWSLVTSTFSHALGTLNHLFVNGLFLYFFGPSVENIAGRRRYVAFFLIVGALTGIAQVSIESLGSVYYPAYFEARPALGASGALMGLFGILLVLTPKSKMIIFPLPVPIPFYIAGFVYVLMDVLRSFNPESTVGSFAHLSGIAFGAAYGFKIKRDLARRGLRLVYS